MHENVDCVVIGAGVVGLACAAALAAAGREVLVLEKENRIGSETSSRNSEVIHAGIYYRPGSAKARLCLEGRRMLYAYCADRGIAHRRIGKIIVATAAAQVARLQAIRETALANGVADLAWLSAADLRTLEPDVAAVRGLLSPSTGIIDSHALMVALEGDLATHGGMVVLNAPVLSGHCDSDGITLRVGGAEPMDLRARSVVNSAGLHAPGLAAAFGGLPREHVPHPLLAIGHYYRMDGRAPFEHLVYPVPEEGGLGIHLTLDLGGKARFGPDVRWIDSIDYSFDDSRFGQFVEAIRSYYPAVEEARLHPDYTGIRPKLGGPGAGAGGGGGGDQDFRIDDVAVHGIPGLVNLFGIESPGLTSSLAIGALVARRLGCRAAPLRSASA